MNTYSSNFATFVQIQVRFQRFSREGRQLHELLVKKHNSLHHHVDILQDGPGQQNFSYFYELVHQFLSLKRVERVLRLHVDELNLRELGSLEEIEVSDVRRRVVYLI